jgi:hypothetical protein
MDINAHYEAAVKTPNDIYQHIPTLRKYATSCDYITEMGVRSLVSTWAFLKAHPKSLISIDIEKCPYEEAERLAKNAGIKFKFIQGDTTKISIAPTDLLFIDTWHVYEQLKKELDLHSGKVRKYIILHDTTIFGKNGETEGHRGLWPAVEEFIKANPAWTIKERYTNNNGLTVLTKRNANG